MARNSVALAQRQGSESVHVPYAVLSGIAGEEAPDQSVLIEGDKATIRVENTEPQQPAAPASSTSTKSNLRGLPDPKRTRRKLDAIWEQRDQIQFHDRRRTLSELHARSSDRKRHSSTRSHRLRYDHKVQSKRDLLLLHEIEKKNPTIDQQLENIQKTTHQNNYPQLKNQIATDGHDKAETVKELRGEQLKKIKGLYRGSLKKIHADSLLTSKKREAPVELAVLALHGVRYLSPGS